MAENAWRDRRRLDNRIVSTYSKMQSVSVKVIKVKVKVISKGSFVPL